MYSKKKKKKKFIPMHPIWVHFIYICEGIEENRDCSGRGILLKSTETATYSWVLADALASSASRSSTYSSSSVNLPETFSQFCPFGGRNWEGTRKTMNREVKNGKLNELHKLGQTQWVERVRNFFFFFNLCNTLKLVNHIKLTIFHM